MYSNFGEKEHQENNSNKLIDGGEKEVKRFIPRA